MKNIGSKKSNNMSEIKVNLAMFNRKNYKILYFGHEEMRREHYHNFATF